MMVSNVFVLLSQWVFPMLCPMLWIYLFSNLVSPINQNLVDTMNSFKWGTNKDTTGQLLSQLRIIDHPDRIVWSSPCLQSSIGRTFAPQSKKFVASQIDDQSNLVVWDVWLVSTVVSGWNDERYFLLGWIAKIKCSICSVIFDKITSTLWNHYQTIFWACGHFQLADSPQDDHWIAFLIDCRPFGVPPTTTTKPKPKQTTHQHNVKSINPT